MASRDSGTVRPTKRKRVFFTAAVLLIVCVLAVGAVSAVEVSNFTELKNAITSANDDTTIVVTGNISIGADDAIPAITKNILLTTTADTDHRIYRTAANTSNQNGMFTVQSGGNLTIRGNNSGTLTLDGNKIEVSNNGQTLVWINSGGNFTLNSGGVLTNNKESTGRGGGVYVNGGAFWMNGGKITNNTADSGGAVVLEEAGRFTMSDGEISNNTANTNGGGVFMKTKLSTFDMSGGTIFNNTAYKKSSETGLGTGHGGGVHIDEGTFTMSNNAKIAGNNAKEEGGGVYVHSGGTFVMSGGEISDNTAATNGGGVCANTTGAFEMSNGNITGNEATGSGGGVCMKDGSRYFTMSGGTIIKNSATNGDGVYVGSIFNLEGNGMVDSVYLPEGKNITVTRDLNDAAQVTGIIPAIPADPQKEPLVVDLASVTEDYLSQFKLDSSVENFALKYQMSPTAGLVLTPIYTVTFNANGGTSVPFQMKVVSGNTVEKPKTTREGYTLEGWYYGTMKWDFTQTTVKNNITLTANWTRNTYTVTFEANGGSEVQPQTVNHGDTVSEPDDPARDDHTFAGWHADATFQTLWNFATSVTSDLTLYAKWTPNEPGPEPPSGGGSSDGNMENAYRVLFNDGATTLYIVTDLSAGDKLTKPEDPVKDGYTFAGWHKDTACTQAWDFNDGITGSMTLYAKWTPQEPVTPTATATATPTVTATATITSTPTGDASPAPTSQPDTNGNSGDTTNGETPAAAGISLSYLIGGILILLLAILLLLILLLRHTVTFLIPTGGELEEYRIKVWHGRYINTEDLPALIRTAAWYRDPARQERWDFDQDRVKKSIELYLG
ncbi:MAG TPA: InlB B-repeat-containing protein [Methanocorpusculum sp.]|nr:InlB B-repeat-containing protein [Methanocorpusculum sp.]